MSHEYLIASLPTLRLGDPPPFTGEELAQRSANLLSEYEQRELAAALAGRPEQGRSEYCVRWAAFEGALRDELVKLRAQRLGVEARAWLSEPLPHPEEARLALETQNQPDPGARELALDRARMDRLQELAGLDPFTLAGVLSYAARLRIVERWAALDPDEGSRRVDELVDASTESKGEQDS